jgi:hypothetical protein
MLIFTMLTSPQYASISAETWRAGILKATSSCGGRAHYQCSSHDVAGLVWLARAFSTHIR